MDDGMNFFQYVASNSIKFIDPFGLHKEDNWYDLPAELRNNKKFRRFVEESKEGLELPRGFQYSRRQMLDLAEEFADSGGLSPKARQKISKALRNMKGKAGGLALVALGMYYVMDDVAAAITDPRAPCRQFLEAIDQAAMSKIL